MSKSNEKQSSPQPEKEAEDLKKIDKKALEDSIKKKKEAIENEKIVRK